MAMTTESLGKDIIVMLNHQATAVSNEISEINESIEELRGKLPELDAQRKAIRLEIERQNTLPNARLALE